MSTKNTANKKASSGKAPEPSKRRATSRVTGTSNEANKNLVAARVRVVLFAAFAAFSVWVTAGAWGLDGTFSFWADRVG